MNKNIEKEQKTLFCIYIKIFIDVFLVGILGFYFFDGLNVSPDAKTVWQTIGVMLLLAGIPLGMKLFHDKTKPIEAMEDLSAAWKIYRKWWIVRAALIVGALLVNLFLFILLRDNSMFYCLLMSLAAWLFCKPDKLKKIEEI